MEEDGEGNVIVADSCNDRIQIFSRDGTFPTKWARKEVEMVSFTILMMLQWMQNGTIVADNQNERIQVFLRDGTFLTKWGTKSEDYQLNKPCGVPVDGEGNIIIADTYNNHIQVFGRIKVKGHNGTNPKLYILFNTL